MSTDPLNLTPALHEYLLQVSLREDPVARALRERTLQLPQRNMLSSPEQVQLLALLAGLLDARHVLEVGTFTGYTALRLAQALAPDAHLVCCDINAAWPAIGRPFWERAGVADRIELRIGPALETLQALLAEGGAGSYDFAYIDADKTGYLAYYERCLTLLRPGGLLALDNMLWGGSVIDPAKTDTETEAIRALNRHLHGDQRVALSLVPIGDGLALARKMAVRGTAPRAGGTNLA